LVLFFDNLDPLALLIDIIDRLAGPLDGLAVIREGHGLPVGPEFHSYHIPGL
jgi:hypothetical protein